MAETGAEDVMSEPLGLYRESPVEPAEEGASETAGLAALKPTTQTQTQTAKLVMWPQS